MIERLKSLVASVRPPNVREHLQLPALQAGHASLSIASGMTPQEAIARLARNTELPDSGAVLVIPSVADRPGQGAHPHLVAALLSHIGTEAVLGVPYGTPSPVRRRWQQLARKQGASSLRLGAEGWDSVELDGDGFMLDQVLIPAELRQFPDRIAIPAIGDSTLGLGFVSTMCHPHTRLRAGGTTERARLEAEIARSTSFRYLLDATRLPGLIAANLAAYAPDPTTIELAGLAIHRFIDQARGFETTGAWEQPRIQAAAELGMGPATGDEIELTLSREDSRLRDLIEFMSLELSCPVRWHGGEAADA